MSLMPWFGVGRGGNRDWLSPELWDPFGVGLMGLDSVDRGRDPNDPAALALANVDWRETENAHVVRADIPGVRKEEVKVQVEDGNILQISGERVKEQEDKTDKWHRVERQRGSFIRRFRLPENTKPVEIKCNLEKGGLTVVVPKKERKGSQKNVRSIEVA